jgi:hypothetical protein
VRPGEVDRVAAWSLGNRVYRFNVFIGATQGAFDSAHTLAFQTGTTAGVLTVTVVLGTNMAEQSISMLPAVVILTAARSDVSASSVEVDLTGSITPAPRARWRSHSSMRQGMRSRRRFRRAECDFRGVLSEFRGRDI